MKIVLISDSHGNIANLKHVMGFAKKIDAGAIIHCGDWNNIESVKTVLSSGIPLYSILGNADIDESIANRLQTTAKKFTRTFLELELDGKKVGVIHNSKHLRPSVESVSSIRYLNILFSGHTHKQSEYFINDLRVVNPGALENGISFAIYDTEKDKVEFIHE